MSGVLGEQAVFASTNPLLTLERQAGEQLLRDLTVRSRRTSVCRIALIYVSQISPGGDADLN